MLRGLTPEIYEPLASILTEMDDKHITRAVVVRREHAMFLPIEFTDTKREGFGEHLSLALIETVDRVGQLRPFMHSLKFADRRIETLVNMYEFVTDAFFEPTGKHLNSYWLG